MQIHRISGHTDRGSGGVRAVSLPGDHFQEIIRKFGTVILLAVLILSGMAVQNAGAAVTPGTIDFGSGNSNPTPPPGFPVADTNGIAFDNFDYDAFGRTGDGAATGNSQPTNDPLTTQLIIKSTAGDDFDLVDLWIEDWGSVNDIDFTGYRDGVASGDVSLNNNPTDSGYSQVILNFTCVDEVRISAPGVEFSIDDVQIAAPSGCPVVNSSDSDIIEDTGFSYPTNIDYASYQENVNITSGNSVPVGRFTIRDGGGASDTDSLSTTLTDITFSVTNWANLRRLAIYDAAGTGEIAEVAVGSGTVTFSSLSGLTAADNGSQNFVLRASFNDPVTDNQQFQFTIISATADGAGSGFAAANAGGASTSIAGDRNRIEVTATQMVFTTQPTNTAAGSNIPSFEIRANDGLGNTDLDYNSSINLSINNNPGTSTLSGNTTVNAVSGSASFNDISLNKTGTGYTLDADSGSLTTGTSNAFNITPGAAHHLSFVTQPTNTAAGANISAFTVEVRDGNDNRVTGSSATVTLVISINPGGSTLGGTTSVNASSGVATFNSVNLNKTGTGYTLYANSGSLTGGTSNAFNIMPGAPHHLSFGTQPTNTAAGSNISAFTVQIRDANDNLVTGSSATVTLSINNNPGLSTLGGTISVNASSGVATFNSVNLDKTGTGYTLDADSGGLSGVTSSAFTITPGAAHHLAFGTQPTNTAAGANISAFTVQVFDANDNLVTGSSATVTLSISFNPGSGTLGGTTSINAASGVATFNAVNLDKVGTGYTLDAGSGSLTAATSSAFNITPGAAHHLTFVTQPTNTVAGANISAFTVEVRDAGDNLVTGSSATVTLSISINPGSATLGGTTSVNASSGVATFNAVNLNKTGTGYTLDADSGSLPGGTSNAFNITPGAAHHLSFGTQPTNTAAGANISAFTVEVRDTNDNVVTGSSATVTLSISINPGLSTLGGTTSVNASSGVATFNSVNLNKTGTGYTLDADSGSLATATSSAFNITAGAAHHLSFGTQPTNSVAGANIAAFTVEILDSNDNVVTSSSATVTLSINNNPGTSTLGGTTSVNASSGVATFNAANLNKVGTGYTLDAASAGLSTITSNAFNITPGAADHLAFGTQPSNSSAGANISAFTVEVQDANDNVVTSSSAAIALSISNNPGGSTLSGTTTVNAASGVATFNNISLDNTGTGYTLDANASGVIGGTSNAFDIAGAADSDIVSDATFTHPENIAYDTYQTTNITGAADSVAVAQLVIRDGGASGTDIDGAGTTLTDITFSLSNSANIRRVALYDGATELGMEQAGAASVTFTGLTLTAPDAGSKTFTVRVSFNATVTDNDQFRFTITSATANSSGSIFVDADAGGAASSISGDDNRIEVTATQLVFATQPADQMSGSAISSFTTEARDANNNLDKDNTDAITLGFAANPGSGTISGTNPRTASGGVATFNDISLDKPGTNYQFNANGGSMTAGTSNTFNIVASFIVINELDADQGATDNAEFIELYDGGVGNTPLDGLSVVLVDGATSMPYYNVPLNGQTTDGNGYYTLSLPADTMQDGADAVVLGSNAPIATIDAVVYDTGQADNPTLLLLLNSGQPQVNENADGTSDTVSIARCPNGGGGGKNTDAFTLKTPTPGADNGCSSEPAVTTSAAASVTSDSAVLGGNVTDPGGLPVTERGVCRSTSANPTTADSKQAMGSGTGTFSGTVTGLEPGTIYYVRAYAINSDGTGYGNEISFKTGMVFPVVATGSVSDVTADSATCGGSVSIEAGFSITARGLCWDTAPEPHTATDPHTDDGTALGDFTDQIANLLPETTYYVRAYAQVQSGGLTYTIYGEQVTFTTPRLSVAGFTVAPVSGLLTTEEGGTATFTVRLSDAPASDVTVTLSSSDESEGTVFPSFLTFTPANWSAPQTVTVTGADDMLADGAQSYQIILGPAESADTFYDGLDPDDVSVSNTDDDVAGFAVTPTGIGTSEDGTAATFTVRLSSAPASDVTIALSSSDTGEGTVSPASLTFTPANWNIPQVVTVTGADDAERDGGQEFTVVLAPAVSGDTVYSGLNPQDVTVVNNDNDAAGLVISEVSGTASEDGDAATFTVRLIAQPSATVILSVTSADTGEGTVSPEILTFTTGHWDTPQTVTVTGVDDTVADGDQIFSVSVAPTASGDSEYAALSPVGVSVTNADNDAAGFTVSPVSGNTTESGDTATFTVVLKTQPSAEVTVAVSSSDTGEGTVAPASLTFTAENWNIPQTVTVTGVDDSDADGSQPYTVVLSPAASDDANYNGADPADVTVVNTDNDAAPTPPSPEPTPDTHDFTYYFPLPTVAGSETAEIALFNPAGKSEDGILKAFDASGNQVGSDVSVFLPPHAIDQIRLGDLFEDSGNITSLIFESDADTLFGHTICTDGDDRRAAVPLILNMSEGDIHIPHIASDPTWETGIVLVSSLNSRRSVEIGFDNGASVTLTVPAHGRVSRTIRELFAGNAQPGIGSAVVRNAAGMACVLSFSGTEESGNSYLGSVLLTDETAEELVYPHIAQDDIWWTGIVAYNASDVSCDMEIVPYMADGTPGDAISETLGIGEKIVGLPGELGLPADTAWVAMRATTEGCGLTGFQLFGTNDGMQMGGFGTIAPDGTSGLFPRAGEGGWTGIGMANPGTADADVTLTVYDEDGNLIASENLTLKAGHKLAALAEDLFQDDISGATHIRYSASQEIAAFRLSGSADGRMLDALPGIPLR